MSMFAYLQKSYGPLLSLEFRFFSISWDKIDAVRPNYAYALMLTRHFSQMYYTAMTLGCCLNFVSAQYIVNALMKFDQILRIYWP